MALNDKQHAANIANAAKSTGPRTAAGKRNSSRNSIRHGILCNSVLIDGESRRRFVELLESFHDEFKPTSPSECALIESMAVARWRLMRLWSVESAGITWELRRQSESDAVENPPTRAMFAFRSLGEHGTGLDTLSRYETRYDRQYHRAFTRLLQLRALKPTTEGKSSEGTST
jgi:hypothetical protein